MSGTQSVIFMAMFLTCIFRTPVRRAAANTSNKRVREKYHYDFPERWLLVTYMTIRAREVPLFFYNAFLKPTVVILSVIACGEKGRLMVLGDSQYGCFKEKSLGARGDLSWCMKIPKHL